MYYSSMLVVKEGFGGQNTFSVSYIFMGGKHSLNYLCNLCVERDLKVPTYDLSIENTVKSVNDTTY